MGAGLAAFLGHLFPIYLGFRGGKGVATGAGVVAVLMPGATLAAALAWVTTAAATSTISLASLAAAVVLAAVHVVNVGSLELSEPRTLFALVAVALVFVKHRANLARLARGTESEIAWGTPMRKILHLLALGLWFGSSVFFTFVVTLSLFQSFEGLGKQETRPAWFPLPPAYEWSDAQVQGPKEQGAAPRGMPWDRSFTGIFFCKAPVD